VRIDSGVANGTEVSVYYDPLLAKLIACAETRDLAIARAATALRDYPVLGIRTNIPYLLRILGDERFRDGDFDTSFLDSEGERLLRRPQQIPPAALAAAAVYHMADGDGGGFVVPAGRSAPDPWAELKGWRG
jgi:acetyl/propionyl-CoA carboxylase alpha subunit